MPRLKKAERRGAVVQGWVAPDAIEIRWPSDDELALIDMAIGDALPGEWARERASLKEAIACLVHAAVRRAVAQAALPTEREVAAELAKIERAATEFLEAIAPRGFETIETAAGAARQELEKGLPEVDLIGDARAAVGRLAEAARSRSLDLRTSSARPVKRTTDGDVYLGLIGLEMRRHGRLDRLPTVDADDTAFDFPLFRTCSAFVEIAERMAREAEIAGVPGAAAALSKFEAMTKRKDVSFLKRIRAAYRPTEIEGFSAIEAPKT